MSTITHDKTPHHRREELEEDSMMTPVRKY
jgi:hypothetical protein